MRFKSNDFLNPTSWKFWLLLALSPFAMILAILRLFISVPLALLTWSEKIVHRTNF